MFLKLNVAYRSTEPWARLCPIPARKQAAIIGTDGVVERGGETFRFVAHIVVFDFINSIGPSSEPLCADGILRNEPSSGHQLKCLREMVGI